MEGAITGCLTAFFGGLFAVLANCVCICHCQCCDCFFTTCKQEAAQMAEREERREEERDEERRHALKSEEKKHTEKTSIEIERI